MGQGAGSRVGTGRFQAMGQLDAQLVQPPHRSAPVEGGAAVVRQHLVGERGVHPRGVAVHS
jgi:hypothetical protein